MAWMEWITLSHSLFADVPVGVAILLPWALVAAQRGGRGIRPWWVTCRYLGWAGFLSSLLAVFSGFLKARSLGAISQGAYLPSRLGLPFVREHLGLTLASLVLAALYLRVAFRKREEYQGFGFLPLAVGLLWSASILTSSWLGNAFLAKRLLPASQPVNTETAPSKAKPTSTAGNESQVPTRLLDFASLEPVQAEPVRSAPHGNRWIRVWTNATAAEAYRAGTALPAGSFVAMSSQEDRWGRPGSELGPLYGLEIKADGSPALSFYWGRVPEARRNETKGETRVYWRTGDPNLQSCTFCHAQGAAPAVDRSRGMRRKPATSEGPLG